MSTDHALAPEPTAPHGPTGGASRRTGLLMVLTGAVGWLAAFQLTVDDWHLLKDPAYQPACNISR
jgi:hypothetical protein